MDDFNLSNFNIDFLEEELLEMDVSPSLIDLIYQLLDPDPNHRPTFHDIMNHHWFDELYDEDERNLDVKIEF